MTAAHVDLPRRVARDLAPTPPEIANAWAAFAHIDVRGVSVPYTVSGVGARPDDAAWTTSAGALFGDMALEEAARLPAGITRVIAMLAARIGRPLMHRFDPVLMLNSTGLSTQLHDAATSSVLPDAVAMLEARHPGCAVVLRSLDARHGASPLAWARSQGWCLLPTRRVWYQRAADAELWRRRNVLHDIKHARHVLADPRAGWRVLTPADAPRVAELYAQLYLDKYSRHNPHFSSAYLARALDDGWLSGEGLVYDGQLVAALAGWRRDGYATYPVFGYDLGAPQSLGLYRLLSLRALERARAAGDVLHASAGADGFKASRGGEAETEWIAVHDAPLPASQRLAWRTLATVATSAARYVFPDTPEVGS